jgi:nitrogen fixation protein FixH
MRPFIPFLCLFMLIAVACKSNEPIPNSESRPVEHPLQMAVTTAPSQLRMDKSFTVRVHLLDPAGAPVTGAKVAGTLSMKEMNHGNSHFDFTEKGHGVYEGISKVEMSGEWNLKLSAEHGADRLEQDVPLTVGD